MDKRLSISLTPREILLGLTCWLVQLFLLPKLLDTFSGQLSTAWQNVVFYCINFLFITAVCHRLVAQSLNSVTTNWRRLVYAAVFGLCGYYSSSYFWSDILTLFFPGISNINDASVFAMLEEAGFVLAFCTIVLVPVSEELLFRGVVFGSLYEKNPVFAYTLSAAAFCAAHVLGYVGTVPFPILLANFLQYIPAGLCLAWAYAKADNILAPILIHSIVNALGVASMR